MTLSCLCSILQFRQYGPAPNSPTALLTTPYDGNQLLNRLLLVCCSITLEGHKQRIDLLKRENCFKSKTPEVICKDRFQNRFTNSTPKPSFPRLLRKRNDKQPGHHTKLQQTWWHEEILIHIQFFPFCQLKIVKWLDWTLTSGRDKRMTLEMSPI